jgi:phage nucleotide-binding protein
MPINVFLTAWEDTNEITHESGQIITQYVPQIRKQVLNQLLGLTDVVGRIKINEKTGNRGVILQGNDGVYAKNRLDERVACPIEELFLFTQEPPKKQRTARSESISKLQKSEEK